MEGKPRVHNIICKASNEPPLPPPPPVCGLNRVYLEAGTRVFCYLIKKKERQLPNKPYVGFWVGKAGNLNNLNNLNIGVDPGEGVGPGI